MKNVANLSRADREELFLVTAREKKLPEAVIEKDFESVTEGRFCCHTRVLPICRNPAQPASSRSKAVDSKPAHSFQTARSKGRVSPVSDKPDRSYYCDVVLSCLK